jgi:hypothetical protein
MTKVGDALFAVAHWDEVPAAEPREDSTVVAIVRLAESGRSWFITAVYRTAEGMEVDGYEPGCQYSGRRGFHVPVAFFETAARANAESLLIQRLRTPTPLAELEDVAL